MIYTKYSQSIINHCSPKIIRRAGIQMTIYERTKNDQTIWYRFIDEPSKRTRTIVKLNPNTGAFKRQTFKW